MGAGLEAAGISDNMNGEDRDEAYLDTMEEIQERTYEELTGDVVPDITLLVCDRCEKCRGFTDVVAGIGIGDIVLLDSEKGERIRERYGLSDEHPVLIAEGEIQFTRRALSEEEFVEWFKLRYGYEP